MSSFSPARLAVIPLADLPLAGSPPSAIDAVVSTSTAPRRIEKRNGYNALEVTIDPGDLSFTPSGSGDYAVYRYWQEPQAWIPEGPRGATPFTMDAAAGPSGMVPARISTAEQPCYLAVVLVNGGGVQINFNLADALVLEQHR